MTPPERQTREAGDATSVSARLPPGGESAIACASSIFGNDLMAVIGFGSWARRELWDTSDVDLLMVLADHVELTRELYRTWDSAAPSSDGRPVDVHFAHLLPDERLGAGLWAEVATDGIVLFERDDRVSSRLAGVRRDIAAGRLLRRTTHGQPYWIEGP